MLDYKLSMLPSCPLHLDGHMDLAPPSIISESMLRWPGPEQLPQFMQSNSRFIMSAAMTGLLTRFIWVVPPWVTDINYFLQSGHFRRQFYAGVTYSKRLPPAEKLRGFDTKTAYALLFAGAPPDQKDDLLKQNVQMSDLQVLPVRAGNIPSAGDGPPLNKSRTHRNREPRLCICFSGNSDGDETSSCFLGEGLSDKKPVFLPATDCQISHSGVVEVVTESKAMELMRPGRGEAERRPWLSEADSVLLDIDEDYYGCEAAIRPLLETGLTEQMVGVVSDYVSRLFCPINSEQESRADAFFNSLVHSVLENVLVCGRNFTCLRNLRARSEKLATMAVGELLTRGLFSFTCSSRKPTQAGSLASLIRILSQMTVGQLRALARVGICVRESVRTFNFRPHYGMVVCRGFNTPSSTAVIFHTPDDEEITLRSENLRALLRSAPFTPGLVTVARSVRDGYTPRQHFRRIENDIVSILNDTFVERTKGSVMYDPGLLGGRPGWPDRH
nr:hypothetical protein BaRGS_003276 [Batillaria attramentaria]